MKKGINLIIIIVAIVLTSCGSTNTNEKHVDTKPHHEWDYSGESGPENWSELEEGSECSGLHQSPINIIDIETVSGKVVNQIEDIKYEDLTTIKSITNNGHTIQFNFDGNKNIIGYEKKEYKMKQFHFHSPSEHTINGVRYPLEIHMVHHSEETNSYIVFAILVQQGEPDSTFTFLENYLPIKEGETKEVNQSFDFGTTTQDFFGVDSINLYSYNGSLTTPPCTEKVVWVVMKDASSASPQQIEMLQKLMPKNNYRETQPINGRTVYRETIKE